MNGRQQTEKPIRSVCKPTTAPLAPPPWIKSRNNVMWLVQEDLLTRLGDWVRSRDLVYPTLFVKTPPAAISTWILITMVTIHQVQE